jgi:D-serine deaminase-like pyridoxal phosphate-dependent protein
MDTPSAKSLMDDVAAILSADLRGTAIRDLDTPVPLVDVEIAERNIVRWQAQCDRLGVANRPHMKTHKQPLFARRQIAAGAIGMTCQKLGEAESMVAAGVTDIFITYNIVGASKLARLAALAQKATVSTVADSEAVVAGLAAAFADAEKPLTVLVECDTGGNRCGVQRPEAAVSLARMIDRSPGLHFGGWMTYPPPGARLASDRFFEQANALAGDAGLVVERISSGGTPDMWSTLGLERVTEYRAGTYVYNDRSRVEKGICRIEDCAITVLATIVSRPTPDRAIIDAGTKSLTSDLIGLNGYGSIIGIPGATIPRADEEHGYVQFVEPRDDLPVGTQLRILPNHACVISNLFDEVCLVKGETVLGMTPITSRGRVR